MQKIDTTRLKPLLMHPTIPRTHISTWLPHRPDPRPLAPPPPTHAHPPTPPPEPCMSTQTYAHYHRARRRIACMQARMPGARSCSMLLPRLQARQAEIACADSCCHVPKQRLRRRSHQVHQSQESKEAPPCAHTLMRRTVLYGTCHMLPVRPQASGCCRLRTSLILPASLTTCRGTCRCATVPPQQLPQPLHRPSLPSAWQA